MALTVKTFENQDTSSADGTITTGLTPTAPFEVTIRTTGGAGSPGKQMRMRVDTSENLEIRINTVQNPGR